MVSMSLILRAMHEAINVLSFPRNFTREKSQPKLKALYDKIYTIFIQSKVLEEEPAYYRLPPVFVNKIVLQ